MRRCLALLLCCLVTASLPSPAAAQAARAVRAAPVAPAVPVVPAFAPSSPSAPSLAAPALPSATPALPAATAAAAKAAPAAAAAGARSAALSAPAAPAKAAALPAGPAPVAREERAGGRPEAASARLAAIAAAKDASPLWTGSVARPSWDAPAVGGAPAASGLRTLSRPLSRPNAAATPAQAPVDIPAQTLARRAADAAHYTYITGSSLWWYTFPRLVERWDEVVESLDSGRERAVKRLMGFFIAHRVLGSTGSYAPMGFRVAAQGVVVNDAWRIYDRYFGDAPPAAREAFARMIERAERFNPNRRSTQFRKVIFHALREAATLPPGEVAALFDAQATEGKAERLASYQARRQDEVLALFDAVTKEVILGLNEGLPAGRRVVGAVLLGSFANGAAGPGSDLDVQALTEDGKTLYNREFLTRLKARWKEVGDPTHPVSGFEYALPLSKPLVTRVHKEPYLVVSPYPEVVAAMSTPAADMKGPDTTRTRGGLAFVVFYSTVLFGVLSVYEAWRLARRALGR